MIAAERSLDLAPDPVRRLGALGVAVTEDARRLTQRLRLSTTETKRLDSMGHRWWRLAGMDEATARRRLYRLGEARFHDRLMLAWARAGRTVDPTPWLQLIPRFCSGTGARTSADTCGRCLAGGGLSTRRGGASDNRRSDRCALFPRSSAIIIYMTETPAAGQRGCGRRLVSCDFLMFFAVLVGFVFFLVFFFIGRIDLGQFHHGQGQGFPEQVAFLAHPHARDGVLVDFRHRDRLAAGFQNDDIAWSQVHGSLPLVG
jgi:hypothetical protein